MFAGRSLRLRETAPADPDRVMLITAASPSKDAGRGSAPLAPRGKAYNPRKQVYTGAASVAEPLSAILAALLLEGPTR